MREPNFSFPSQNRAAICISSSMYDRRALDCTDYIPLINTLTNLAYLTGSTPTIREFITRDGGLERLVTILKHTKVHDKKNGLKWTLAFQCVVNIGIRGTEHIRKRVVQAGMVPVIVNVLESFFTVLKTVSDENERRRMLRRAEAVQQNSQPIITNGELSTDQDPQLSTAPLSVEQEQQPHAGQDTLNNSSSSSFSSTTTSSLGPSTANLSPATSAFYNRGTMDNTQGPSTMPTTQEPMQAHLNPNSTRSLPIQVVDGRPQQQLPQFFYREDDILHSLQLLAYLSKYPSLRSAFHTDTGSNVFAIVEKFTNKAMYPVEIQYWAGVIMRNACRKDDSRKGIRQCAYIGCGKWETQPREFAKCRRCRKAKYCSKQCQSKAWNEGHRWWCVEKKPESMGVSSSFGTDPAPPPPPPPADLQDQPDTSPSLMENGSISSMASGAGGARMIGGGEGGSSTSHHVHRIHQPQIQQQQRPISSPVPVSQPHIPVLATSVSIPMPMGAQAPYQQQLLQRQRISLPPQSQSQPQQQQQQQHEQLRHQLVLDAYVQGQQNQQQNQQQMFMLQQQQRPGQQPLPQQQHQQQQLPHMRNAPSSSTRHHHVIGPPQRSMTQPHPTTAPVRSSRNGITPHLGFTPDSPTPEQLAQRFVQQAALYPGQHNELVQGLNAQFQQYFPPHHQEEAKRQFSFHLRKLFARNQRQQELMRTEGPGSSFQNSSSRGLVYGPPPASMMAPGVPRTSGMSTSGSSMDVSRQGTPRRRSDLDSDDEDSARSSHMMSNSSLTVPMLTQDLSTTMSLTSTELSGPLPTSLMNARMSGNSTHPAPSAASANYPGGLDSNGDHATARDFKVRKLMSPDEPSNRNGSSSAALRTSEPVQREDEWTYSRHMANDSSMDP
ncbi:hypothetical protein BX616_000251 [Lobosporangium transversale]|nr:hypothetical protein BX616_000251 [Lobosporangium transversale]